MYQLWTLPHSIVLFVSLLIEIHTIFNRYLHHVINESLRLSILTPYAARFQDSDTELGGHIIPAGVRIKSVLIQRLLVQILLFSIYFFSNKTEWIDGKLASGIKNIYFGFTLMCVSTVYSVLSEFCETSQSKYALIIKYISWQSLEGNHYMH